MTKYVRKNGILHHQQHLRQMRLLLLPLLMMIAQQQQIGCCAFQFRNISPLAFVPVTSYYYQPPPVLYPFRSTATNDDHPLEENINNNIGIDLNQDARLYKVRLSRAVGIDWGTDLSFSFVYVRNLEPAGAADISGQVQVGDQLCEISPVVSSNDDSLLSINLIGAPFDYVMSSFANLDRSVTELDFVFFRGTKNELKGICTGELAQPEPETITVTVIQNKGATNESVQTLTAPRGVNLRELLVNNGINVYQSVTRWTNCKGKQLCGTCIINVQQQDGGSRFTNRKSMDEASTLRENPDSYRLSCVTFAYGDCTVETFPPVNVSQWTR